LQIIKYKVTTQRVYILLQIKAFSHGKRAHIGICNRLSTKTTPIWRKRWIRWV